MNTTIQEQVFRSSTPHLQLRQLQEECGELIVAVNHLNRGRIEPERLIGEMIDVEIMLDQFRSWFGDDAWNKHKNAKLVRIQDKLSNGGLL